MEKNIITIEDPVEYRLEGINQVQVNPKAGPDCQWIKSYFEDRIQIL